MSIFHLAFEIFHLPFVAYGSCDFVDRFSLQPKARSTKINERTRSTMENEKCQMTNGN